MAAAATVRRVEVEDEPPAGIIRWLISCDESGIGGLPYYGFGTLWMSATSPGIAEVLGDGSGHLLVGQGAHAGLWRVREQLGPMGDGEGHLDDADDRLLFRLAWSEGAISR